MPFGMRPNFNPQCRYSVTRMLTKSLRMIIRMTIFLRSRADPKSPKFSKLFLNLQSARFWVWYSACADQARLAAMDVVLGVCKGASEAARKHNLRRKQNVQHYLDSWRSQPGKMEELKAAHNVLLSSGCAPRTPLATLANIVGSNCNRFPWKA